MALRLSAECAVLCGVLLGVLASGLADALPYERACVWGCVDAVILGWCDGMPSLA